MTYYPTLDEDLARAKEMLAEGTPEEESLARLPATIRRAGGGTIFGKDIYAAYKLLESFVAAIEDYQRSFALYYKASMALMDAYKRTHPDVPDLVWPAATAVNVWASGEIEALRAKLDAAEIGLGTLQEQKARLQAEAEAMRQQILDVQRRAEDAERENEDVQIWNERLRATLPADPFDHNAECRFCDEQGEHADDCVWLRAQPLKPQEPPR